MTKKHPLSPDNGTEFIGFSNALNLIKSKIDPIGIEQLPLESCTGRIVAAELIANVDNPRNDISLMDGFAVKTNDVVDSSQEHPLLLKIIGSAFAGTPFDGPVAAGTAVKIFSGALIPEGSNAVVPIEYCDENTLSVSVKSSAEPGSNIVRRGEEIKAGELVIEKGKRISAGYAGLAVTAGIKEVKVYKNPRVSVLAIGDELVAPGKELLPGQTYANNLSTIYAWLTSFGIPCDTAIVSDDRSAIRSKLLSHLSFADAVITCGGAWRSERDFIVNILNKLGWNMLFSHLRMRPGKGTSFGFLQDKPVFCLPGGPASNQKAFLELALPGIARLGGEINEPLQTLFAKLSVTIKSNYRNWTEFKDARLSQDGSGNLFVSLFENLSSLQTIARANCIVCIPEAKDSLTEGDLIPVQLLTPTIETSY